MYTPRAPVSGSWEFSLPKMRTHVAMWLPCRSQLYRRFLLLFFPRVAWKSSLNAKKLIPSVMYHIEACIFMVTYILYTYVHIHIYVCPCPHIWIFKIFRVWHVLVSPCDTRVRVNYIIGDESSRGGYHLIKWQALQKWGWGWSWHCQTSTSNLSKSLLG